MRTFNNRLWEIGALVVLLASPGTAQNFTIFAESLQWPLRLTFTPQGNLLVSEGGAAEENTGRVSVLDRAGARRSLLEGLPSGPAHFVNPYGPTSMAVDGSTLYLLLGENVYAGAPPNLIINPAGPPSPAFSSVLKIQFSADVDRVRGSFRMHLGDHWGLADGYDVNLRNTEGETARVSMLAAFRPLVRNVLGGPSPNRQSDPFGIALDARNNALYLTDAGMETVSRVDTNTGRFQVMVRFRPFIRGGMPVDNVPTGLCQLGDQLLVGFLTGAPFPAGEASLRSFDPRTYDEQQYIGGLQTVLDMVCIKAATGPDRVYTLESAPTGPNNARLRVYDGSAGRVIAEGMPSSSGMARDPISGDIFIANLGLGRILRVPVQ